MVTFFPVRFSHAPEGLNLQEMEWDRLIRQIRDNPDPKVRQAASSEAMKRVWDGPGQPESRIPARMFLPEE